MNKGLSPRLPLLSLLLTTAFTLPAHADLVIAHVAPLTGPVAIEAKEYNLGIRLAIAAANAGGGINGQKLNLRTEDDEYTPEKTVAILNKLGNSDTLATLLPIGSPSMTKVLQEKVLENNKLPMVGVIPGAEPLRTPGSPYLYHVRAGDLDQYRKLVEHAVTIGLNRFAIAYADIPFGKAGAAAIESLLKEKSKNLLGQFPFAVGSGDLGEVMNGLAKVTPDIVFVVTPAKRAGEFVQAYRAKGLPGVIAMPSYGNAPTLCQIAGDDKARGVFMSQVFPNIRNTAIPVVRQYQEDLRNYGEKEQKASLFQFEAYVTTKVLVEGLKRSGKEVNREKLVSALDNMSKFDLGGFSVGFAAGKHNGSNFVDISIIGRDCQLMY